MYVRGAFSLKARVLFFSTRLQGEFATRTHQQSSDTRILKFSERSNVESRLQRWAAAGLPHSQFQIGKYPESCPKKLAQQTS